MSRKPLRSPRLARKTREKKIKQAVLISLLSFCIVGALIYALLQPDFRIRDIQIDGSAAVPKEGITELIRQGLTGSYLGFIPKEHILFYPKDTLTAGVLAAFPELSRVELERGGLSIIHISAVSREPHVIWCEGQDCYFMDQSGFVFAAAPKDAEPLYYRLQNTEATSTPLGTARLAPERLAPLFSLLTGLEEMGLQPEELLLLPSGEHTVLLRGGVRLFFSSGQFDVALSRLQALLSEKGLVPREGTVGLNVDYIDLRFGNKIYFK